MRYPQLAYRAACLGIAGILFMGLTGCSNPLPKNEDETAVSDILVQKASAQELYQLFQSPCCGKPIDTECCGMAKERKAFVDGIVAEGPAKDDAVMMYVKRYGLNSFMDENEKTKFRDALISLAPADRPIVSLSPTSKDLGDISQKKGVVSTIFELKNDGKTDLVIDKLETSCGCTTAAIVLNGEEGPRFGMPGHGMNEKITDWQIIVSPGEQAELKVYYDPNVHKKFRGAAMRDIYVFSNDPIDVQKKVSIRLKQVD